MRVQNATGDSLFNVAANGNIAMGGLASDTYKLSVVGSVNATALYQQGNKVCDVSNNCGAIKNGTNPQTADINISGGATFGGTLTVTGNTTFSGAMISFSNNVRGYNVVVVASATSQTITFGTAYPDANYAVLCTPNFNTTCYITNKTTTGFTINYGTAAPSDGSGRVDWFVLH
jgi:hypothetical protein